MDHCPAHPEWLMDIQPNVQVVFLPPSTTSVLQPLDQEVIATVTARYHATVFRQLRHATESNNELRQILAKDSSADSDSGIDEPMEEEEKRTPLYQHSMSQCISFGRNLLLKMLLIT